MTYEEAKAIVDPAMKQLEDAGVVFYLAVEDRDHQFIAGGSKIHPPFAIAIIADLSGNMCQAHPDERFADSRPKCAESSAVRGN